MRGSLHRDGRQTLRDRKPQRREGPSETAEEVVTILVEKYQARVLQFIGMRVRNRATAEDLTQDTFAGLLRYFNDHPDDLARAATDIAIVREPSAVAKRHGDSEGSATWTLIRKIAHRKTIDCWRRRAIRRELLATDLKGRKGSDDEEAAFEPPSCESGPVESAIGNETAVLVAMLLETLDETQATVVRLRVLREMTPAEVAEELGTSPAAVSTRLCRALKQLREFSCQRGEMR